MTNPFPVTVPNIHTLGMVKDTPPHKMPAEAWSTLRNFHIQDGGLASGPVPAALITPTVEPYAILSTPLEGSIGVYFSLTKAYGFTSASQADVTRAAGDYTGTAADLWHRAMFRGFGVYNNGKDIPQVWNPISLAVPLINLPDWPANTTARVLRGYKNVLVALGVTKSSIYDPRLVKWSDLADPNTLPATWDEADATRAAGEYSLSEGDKPLVDCLPLQDFNVLYTTEETWVMRLVDGQEIFTFYRVFPDTGLLALDCVTQVKQQHFLLTQDDVVMHNLQQVQSVADGSVRRWLFRRIHPSGFHFTKVLHLSSRREVWIIFSQSGTQLDTCLVWNYLFNAWTQRDWPTSRSASVIRLGTTFALDTWDIEDAGTWEDWGETWDSTTVERIAPSVIYASGGDIFRVHPDNTGAIECYAEKLDLIKVGPEAVDSYTYKLVLSLRPLTDAPVGTVFHYRAGFRDELQAPVQWQSERQFVVGTDLEMSFNVTGRFISFSVRVSSAVAWTWFEYTYELTLLKEAL